MPFPPALGRLLSCVAENPGVSSRDLCEFLDVRPSSLSEILARAENEGWIIRTVSEEDRRLRARNKWLLAHPESREARDGAVVGLRGKNLDISE